MQTVVIAISFAISFAFFMPFDTCYILASSLLLLLLQQDLAFAYQFDPLRLLLLFLRVSQLDILESDPEVAGTISLYSTDPMIFFSAVPVIEIHENFILIDKLGGRWLINESMNFEPMNLILTGIGFFYQHCIDEL